jgi:hypothetical protein
VTALTTDYKAGAEAYARYKSDLAKRPLPCSSRYTLLSGSTN